MHFHFKTYLLILQAFRRNKMRTFLTSLGIIIGISSVIMIMSVGAGAQSLVVNQVKSIGTDLIGVLPGASESDGPPATVFGIVITTLTYNDAKAIVNQIPQVQGVAAYVRGVATASWQGEVVDTSFLGVSGNYLQIESSAEVAKGNFFAEEQTEQVAREAVLGSQVAEDLFDGQEALGQSIKINKENFRVIGVMKERGSSGFQNQDNQIFITLGAAQKLMLGINYVSFLRAKVAPDVDIDYVVSEIEHVLREQHNISNPADDDFTVRSAEQGLDTLKSLTNALNYFLAMVAAISLLVGGIGIMNIMLVSVTESTREIGLRKAVGATKRDISVQYLAQTVLLSALGGIIGIIWGVLISGLVALVANALGYSWDFVISLGSILMAVSFIVLVGIFFGWYPASKAANLNPIEALRYE
ncbi:MAG: ABC transporter permease [Patescibacteria group bacterium]